MTNIGFVGLGHMGLPMALNLVRAGHRVTGYDVQVSVREAFSKAGGLVVSRLQDVFKDQDLFITMLQTGQQVLHVGLGIDGLLSGAKKEALWIDSSTIDIKVSRELHKLAKESQVLFVDAPVSGGVAGAKAASLTFMVGGEEQVYLKAKPFLSLMGQKIIYAGEAGSGQAAKICNNLILGISMTAVSEAFNLAEHLGLSAQKLFEVVSNSSGNCWVVEKYLPVPNIVEGVPANHAYQPGFTAAMMLKDLLLSQKAAKDLGVETPLGARTTELYQQLLDQNLGELDFSAIIQLLAKS